MKYTPIILLIAFLFTACGNGNGRKSEAPIDGGHGIGIDTATVNEINQYVDSIRAIESTNENE